ncbi:MAG: hypothetical protein AAF851_22855, partial [Myxococcota bacterium]
VGLGWAIDTPPSQGQVGGFCPWDDGEGSFTRRIELASVPRSGALDPSDVIVSFHPPGTYGVTRERAVPFGCGGATEEVSVCDLNTVRVRVTEGLAGAVLSLRGDGLTELQANLLRTVDGFDVFEFSGVGLAFEGGDEADSVFVFSSQSTSELALLSQACRVNFDFDPSELQEMIPCLFEEF